MVLSEFVEQSSSPLTNQKQTMPDEPELKLLTGNEINLSLEERWMLVENVADTLYKLMHEVNVETVALTHLELGTGDLHTLRYLVHRVWEHYHKLADDLFDVYKASPEYEE